MALKMSAKILHNSKTMAERERGRETERDKDRQHLKSYRISIDAIAAIDEPQNGLTMDLLLIAYSIFQYSSATTRTTTNDLIT